jgi:hypothetical protein
VGTLEGYPGVMAYSSAMPRYTIEYKGIIRIASYMECSSGVNFSRVIGPVLFDTQSCIVYAGDDGASKAATLADSGLKLLARGMYHGRV